MVLELAIDGLFFSVTGLIKKKTKNKIDSPIPPINTSKADGGILSAVLLFSSSEDSSKWLQLWIELKFPTSHLTKIDP